MLIKELKSNNLIYYYNTINEGLVIYVIRSVVCRVKIILMAAKLI